ncbi:MAG: sulfotransferase, partial [Pseudohongiellaceae bacterium]
MSDKPIFVGGFRSGTTLLINLLGLHPCIVPWFETKAFVEALRWMRVLSDPDQQEFERAYCVPPEPAGFTASAVARRMQADFEATAARVSGRIANGKAGYERYPLGADCIHYTPHRAQQALQEWQDSLSATAGFDELARATGRMIKDLGEEQLQLGGGRIWINKTPEISRFAEQLRACLGGCRIIYMVRNGMDVVSSA